MVKVSTVIGSFKSKTNDWIIPLELIVG